MNKLGIFMNFWELNWAADHAKYINKAADIGFDILEFQAQALLELDTDDPHRIFGSPDDLKLRSSMTLFEAAEGKGGIFTKVIEKYYGGRRDQKTIELLKKIAG